MSRKLTRIEIDALCHESKPCKHNCKLTYEDGKVVEGLQNADSIKIILKNLGYTGSIEWHHEHYFAFPSHKSTIWVGLRDTRETKRITFPTHFDGILMDPRDYSFSIELAIRKAWGIPRYTQIAFRAIHSQDLEHAECDYILEIKKEEGPSPVERLLDSEWKNTDKSPDKSINQIFKEFRERFSRKWKVLNKM